MADLQFVRGYVELFISAVAVCPTVCQCVPLSLHRPGGVKCTGWNQVYLLGVTLGLASRYQWWSVFLSCTPVHPTVQYLQFNLLVFSLFQIARNSHDLKCWKRFNCNCLKLVQYYRVAAAPVDEWQLAVWNWIPATADKDGESRMERTKTLMEKSWKQNWLPIKF